MLVRQTTRSAAISWTSIVHMGFLLLPAAAQDRVSNTVHNLSVSGSGAVRAETEAAVCIFCHASHNTAGVSPLWNREVRISNYKIYESSTLDAKPGQPTGSSKLCLSCHDGTIAIGKVLSRKERIRMQGDDTVVAGLANLGTDLSDDHPVGLVYSSGLASADRQLASPRGLAKGIELDRQGRIQCTSCHDPHHNKYGNFLVNNDLYGELCTSCHVMDGWSTCTHGSASATVANSRAGDWPHSSVAANACRSCHRSHSAGGRHRLLIHQAEEQNCLVCHDGSVARTNVLAELNKPSGHDPRRYQGVHDPVEVSASERPHVECSDCHNPHSVGSPAAKPPGHIPLGPTMANVRGVAANGNPVRKSNHEFEICFRCHGDSAVSVLQPVSRQAQISSMRLKFSRTNPSFHPVVTPSASPDTVSLKPGMGRGSMIRCTDCHNNNAGPRAGGGGMDGPHGSIYPSLLERNYTTYDDTAESPVAYAMCYKCHRRASLLSDESFPSHRLHIVEERTPCSACHDPHGISATQVFDSDHTHLVNFDTRIVRPAAAAAKMEFRDLGRYSGTCTLSCHGSEHDDRTYGGRMDGATGGNPSGRRLRRR